MTEDGRSRLLEGVSQYDVDFVNPRLRVDIPLGIDPFLLYKSRDPALRGLHGQVLDVFNAGIKRWRAETWPRPGESWISLKPRR